MTIEPNLSLIREAQELLASYFPPTRLVAAPSVSRANVSAYLKLETDLPTASFKPRGAMFALPANPNPVKRKRIADLGARIVEAGGADLAHAFQLANEYSTRPSVYFLNDATDPVLPAGPATIGLEIVAQLPQTTAIYVPVGDTALIRGVAAAVRQTSPGVKIIGVQAERAPSYFLSWKAGRVIPTDTCDTCADGLATRAPEEASVRAIRNLVDDVVLVSEEEMIGAIRVLYKREGIVAEPAGAAATAAFLKHPHSPGPAVLLVTGGNITDDIRKRTRIP
jgi:threonine dehydratase